MSTPTVNPYRPEPEDCAPTRESNFARAAAWLAIYHLEIEFACINTVAWAILAASMAIGWVYWIGLVWVVAVPVVVFVVLATTKETRVTMWLTYDSLMWISAATMVVVSALFTIVGALS